MRVNGLCAVSADRLYTPELLALAVELARWPANAALPVQGEARSRSCGGVLAMGLALDGTGAIAQLGLRVRACAIGQAAAAIFARHAAGRYPADIAAAHDTIGHWLEQGGALPDWPDLALLAPARAYPGRHGAMLLPWKAALSGLSSASAAG